MIKKINFYHSLIFFNICIILSSFAYLRDNNLIIFCLFLILTIGISHGSFYKYKIIDSLGNVQYRIVPYAEYVKRDDECLEKPQQFC